MERTLVARQMSVPFKSFFFDSHPLSVEKTRKHVVEADAKPQEVALPAPAVQIDCEDQQLVSAPCNPERLELEARSMSP